MHTGRNALSVQSNRPVCSTGKQPRLSRVEKYIKNTEIVKFTVSTQFLQRNDSWILQQITKMGKFKNHILRQMKQ